VTGLRLGEPNSSVADRFLQCDAHERDLPRSKGVEICVGVVDRLASVAAGGNPSGRQARQVEKLGDGRDSVARRVAMAYSRRLVRVPSHPESGAPEIDDLTCPGRLADRAQ